MHGGLVGDPESGLARHPKVFALKLAIHSCDSQPFHRVPEGVREFEKLPG